MKVKSIVAGLVSCFTFLTAYADASLQVTPKKSDEQNIGQIRLDQSKDVFFEQFSWSTYSFNLLQAKNKFSNKDLVFGGSSQFDFQHWQGSSIDTTPPQYYRQGTQLYFTQLTVDVMSNLNNDWSTLFLSLSDYHIGQGGPSGNYVYVPQAFLLFGNLEKIPLYLTLGIDTIPFGVFNLSGQWNMPLTADYFMPAQSPLVSIGFYKNNFNAVVTEYKDQANYACHNVYNLFYSNKIHSWSYGVGVGYLTHLQSNSTGNAASNPRRNRVMSTFNLGNVWDFNASLGYESFMLTAESVSGSEKAGTNRGMPRAIAETLSYTHALFGKEATFGVGHSNTISLSDVPTSLDGQNAVPLAASGIKNSWVISVTRPIFTKYLSLGFNAQKDILYSEKQTFTYTLDLMAYL